MLKVILSLIVLMTSVATAQNVATIKGHAPGYLGEQVELFAYEDYLSRLKVQLASSKVGSDSTFSLSFYNEEVRKLRVEIGSNHFYLYAAPGGNYELYVRDRSPYLEQTQKVEAEFFFIDLDSTDINYKVLMFEEEQLNFLKKRYSRSKLRSPDFMAHLDTFKTAIAEKYEDDTSKFFKNYVRYSFAALDNLPYRGHRNRYEKYDFYIKPQTVLYQNDRYMEYVLNYYENYSTELGNQLNQEFYESVIRSSPTRAMNTLGADYALDNIRLREFILIKMLGDVFYSDDYPQTNIMTMLDSIEHHSLFEENGHVAKNLKYRLMDLVPGAQMPQFIVPGKDRKWSRNDFAGKHLYIHFIHMKSDQSLQDLDLLLPLYNQFNKYTEFLTVIVTEDREEWLDEQNAFIKKHKISWPLAVLDEDDDLLDRFNVTSYPHYLLMDATGHVVAAPAYSPRPNNEYETIENILFAIDKRQKRLEGNE